MTEPDSTDSHQPAESTYAADIELQTADTMKLERIDDEPPAPAIEAIAYAQDDTAEMEPAIKTENVVTSATGAPKMSEQPTRQAAQTHTAAVFDDALLDLGDFDSATQRALAEDVILDLDFDEPVGEPLGERLSELGAMAAQPIPESAVFAAAAPAEVIAKAPSYENPPAAVVEPQEWAIVTPAPPVSMVEKQAIADEPDLALSPEAIDAIAHRVVEQLSEKVVREIAWEVVPELAELLIKKRLEEQK